MIFRLCWLCSGFIFCLASPMVTPCMATYGCVGLLGGIIFLRVLILACFYCGLIKHHIFISPACLDRFQSQWNDCPMRGSRLDTKKKARIQFHLPGVWRNIEWVDQMSTNTNNWILITNPDASSLLSDCLFGISVAWIGCYFGAKYFISFCVYTRFLFIILTWNTTNTKPRLISPNIWFTYSAPVWYVCFFPAHVCFPYFGFGWFCGLLFFCSSTT